MANVELAVPVTPKSIFQTGSVGKQFTATAVMMLVDEGKIGLEGFKALLNHPAFKDIPKIAKDPAAIRAIDPSTLIESRTVGRKRLPTTVVGLMVHIAEHTQRHVGQAITTAKIVRGHANP
jgi:hypothetical protein